jgi:hypothetical protein
MRGRQKGSELDQLIELYASMAAMMMTMMTMMVVVVVIVVVVGVGADHGAAVEAASGMPRNHGARSGRITARKHGRGAGIGGCIGGDPASGRRRTTMWRSGAQSCSSDAAT